MLPVLTAGCFPGLVAPNDSFDSVCPGPILKTNPFPNLVFHNLSPLVTITTTWQHLFEVTAAERKTTLLLVG